MERVTLEGVQGGAQVCTIPLGVHMSTQKRTLSPHDGAQSSIKAHLPLTVTRPGVSKGGQDDPRLSRASHKHPPDWV